MVSLTLRFVESTEESHGYLGILIGLRPSPTSAQRFVQQLEVDLQSTSREKETVSEVSEVSEAAKRKKALQYTRETVLLLGVRYVWA